MIGLPAGMRIKIAVCVTDIRSGFTGLAARVQTALDKDPFSGQPFWLCSDELLDLLSSRLYWEFATVVT